MQVDYSCRFELPDESEELLIVTKSNQLSKQLSAFGEWLSRKILEAEEKKDSQAMILFSTVSEKYNQEFYEYFK